MTTADFESPELLALYRTYTGGMGSVGARFGATAQRFDADRPLVVATHGDIALYRGAGKPPVVESFRLGARGFKELAAVSHLGPAVSTLARMRALEPDGDWRACAETMMSAAASARAANSRELWEDKIAVKAFAGREAQIARMVDYSCVLTERLLTRALNEPDYLTDENVRADFLDGASGRVPVAMNRIMVATFFLVGLDVSHRLLTWFDGQELPWEETMVIIAGRQGRPTAGVTRATNSVAKVIEAVSRGRLPATSLLIAPHAPVFPLYDGSTLSEAEALEPTYRQLWSVSLATSDLGARMFTDYPRFDPAPRASDPAGHGSLAEMPPISAPDDWFSLVSRLRLVLEDPRQLLSGAVTDYAAQQLVEVDNDPARVVVPGLDGEPFPESQLVTGEGRAR